MSRQARTLAKTHQTQDQFVGSARTGGGLPKLVEGLAGTLPGAQVVICDPPGFPLAAVVLASVFTRLSPLLTFTFWGSDIGEYFTILRPLNVTGRLPTTYAGWGITYPLFPGMFLAQDAPALLGGIERCCNAATSHE